jgi:hypothetical protein
MLTNMDALSGAGDALFIKAIPWVIVVLFGAGMIAALIFRARSPQRYAQIGAFAPYED